MCSRCPRNNRLRAERQRAGMNEWMNERVPSTRALRTRLPTFPLPVSLCASPPHPYFPLRPFPSTPSSSIKRNWVDSTSIRRLLDISFSPGQKYRNRTLQRCVYEPLTLLWFGPATEITSLIYCNLVLHNSLQLSVFFMVASIICQLMIFTSGTIN